MFESLTLAGSVEKLPGSGDVNANISAWSCGNYELSNRNIEQLQTGSTLCIDDDQLKKEDLEPVGNLSNVGSQTYPTCLSFARNGTPSIFGLKKSWYEQVRNCQGPATIPQPA